LNLINSVLLSSHAIVNMMHMDDDYDD